MSWLFSQALVAEYSAGTCLADGLSAPSNGNPTQLAYLSHGKTTAFSRLSRFGMTCKPLTDDHGAALLTSYLAVSHARTSAQLEVAQESTAPALECGNTWPASSVRYDPAASKWKTAHCLWEEDLPWSSVTLPRWGMTRNGHVYQHPTAERPINATAAGSSAFYMGLTMKPSHSIPTPTASDHIERQNTTGKLNFETNKCVSLDRFVKMWPTPLASDAESAGGIGCWQRGKRGLALNTAVRLEFPSPGYNDYKSGTGYDHGDKKQTPQLRHISGGLLNPTWVEWLMGWPLGWTDLKPLEMDRFREWQQQHLPCCQEVEAGA